jgi:hypothetical protein
MSNGKPEKCKSLLLAGKPVCSSKQAQDKSFRPTILKHKEHFRQHKAFDFFIAKPKIDRLRLHGAILGKKNNSSLLFFLPGFSIDKWPCVTSR